MAATRKVRLFNTPKHIRIHGIKYGSGANARKSIRKIRGQPSNYKRKVAQQMYYRAKFHKYQTPGMRNAMKVWKPLM
jgi:hypothetical protein